MSNSIPSPVDVAGASQVTANLPQSVQVHVSHGGQVTVRRLSWLKFEAVWADLAGLLAALSGTADEAGEEELMTSLSSAPQVILKLVMLCCSENEQQLARWPFDDVLAVAGAALRLNFIDSAGVRDFSSALGGLAELGG